MRDTEDWRSRAAATRAAAFFCVLALTAIAGCGDPMIRGGAMHFEAGRFEKAVQAFEQAVARNPDDAEAHLWLARSYSELGRVNEAIEQYERAAALGRSGASAAERYRLQYWRVQLSRGERLLAEARPMKEGSQRSERIRQAAAALEAATHYSPHKALTDYRLFELYTLRGESERAREALDRAFSKASSDREASSVLVPVLREHGEKAVLDNRYEDALSIYSRAAALRPDDPLVLGDLATAHLLIAEDATTGGAKRLTSYREAARLLERVRKMQPTDPDALYNLATVRMRLGQPTSADSLLRVYLGLKPRDPDGYALFHDVAAQLGHAGEAATADLAAQVMARPSPVQDPAGWARRAYEKFGAASGAGRLYSASGVPDEIHTYRNKNGDLIEIWFYFGKSRVGAFHDGRTAGEIIRFGRP